MKFNPIRQKYLDYCAFMLDYRSNNHISPSSQEVSEKLGMAASTERHYRRIFLAEEHKHARERMTADVTRRWFQVIDGISGDIQKVDRWIRDDIVSVSDRINAVKLKRDLLIDILKITSEGLVFLDDFGNILASEEKRLASDRKASAKSAKKLQKKLAKATSSTSSSPKKDAEANAATATEGND